MKGKEEGRERGTEEKREEMEEKEQSVQPCECSKHSEEGSLTRANVVYSQREPQELRLGVDRTIYIHSLGKALGIETRH